ncbi:hypothetical protein ACOTDI_28115 [Achromobacter xylosoxidans]
MADEITDYGKHLCDKLQLLEDAITNGSTEERSLTDLIGFTAVGLDRYDLRNYVRSFRATVARTTEGIDWADDKRASLATMLSDYATRVEWLSANTAPNLWNGHGAAASNAILVTLLVIEQTLAFYLQWPSEPDQYALPPQLKRRITAASRRLQDIESTSGDIEEKVRQILAAHEAAEAFPADLAQLEEWQDQLKGLRQESAAAHARLMEDSQQGAALLEALKRESSQAEIIVAKCNDAFRMATSTGLAGAFHNRAVALNKSIIAWTVGLLVALTIGSLLGALRINALSTLLNNDNVKWGAITLQIVLSALSVGAPLWFAWLATSQIGQRFRLAEDYAFKASVAKAYEGYREEAKLLDNSEFSTRLFGAALERFEEAPLRLIDKYGVHGSPMHELVQSRAFQAAIETLPGFRERLTTLLKPKADAAKQVARPPPTPSSVLASA